MVEMTGGDMPSSDEPSSNGANRERPTSNEPFGGRPSYGSPADGQRTRRHVAPQGSSPRARGLGLGARGRRRWAAATLAALCSAGMGVDARVARAQAPAPAAPTSAAPAAVDPATVARADAAFEEGRELFDQGRFKEACDKFELSMKLDPSPGTLLNLGNCYEPQGDLVRALATFEQAFADAQRSTDPRRKELWTDAARERIGNLSRRVPQLNVRGAPADARVTLDAKPIARQGGALRLNPGRHRIEVSAPGKRTFTREFEIASGQHLAIQVPALEVDTGPAPASEPVALPPEPPPPVVESDEKAYGIWPYVLGGTGAALLGTSLITGLSAKSKEDRLERECDGNVCDESLLGVKDSAETLGLVTDVLWITGVVVAGFGVTLFVLDATNDEKTQSSVQAGCFDGGCGLRASGRF